MNAAEKNVLARTAMMRHYPDAQDRPVPAWIVELTYGEIPSFHAYDRLMHGGFITWDNGWKLTDAGRKALDAAAPRAARVPSL